jgi:beta-lactamase regulating signal transducer with metallopeptidase domain
MQTFANPFVSSLATTVMSSLWQGFVIACAMSICLKLAPRISAAARFAAWTAGFVVAACLPVLPFIANLGTKANEALVLAAHPGSATGALLHLDLRWSAVIVGLWMAAMLYRGVALVVHSLRLRKLWKSAMPVAINERLAGILADLGRGRVQICSTKALERPSVIGFLSPRILIPDWLLERLTADELEHVVLHEAEHLRRRDDWTNLAQKLLLVVFPLNPALWWMERELCREREMACDEGVVRVTQAPRAYAACLASLAERGLQHRAEALSLGAWQRRSELVHRVHGILLRKQTLRPVASATLLGALGCGLVAGAVEFARCPQLVAFIPAQNAQTAANKDVIAVSTQGDAVFADTRHLDPGFHVVEAKAAMPTGHHAQTNTQPKSSRYKSAAVPVTKIESTDVATTVKPNTLKAEEPQQEWIVFTAVEQIGSDDRSGQLTADFDASMSGDSATATRDSANNNDQRSPVRNQMTFTRLILRILPPNSFPAQPDTASFRNGWFVIQL